MKAATLSEIKRELNGLDQAELVKVCLRLGKFKLENKELLTYLLFEQSDEDAYIRLVKEDITEAFMEINTTNLYWAKKGIRKTLRNLTKQIRYSGVKQTEVEVLLHFCRTLRASGIQYEKSPALKNLFDRQLIKINKAMSTLHEDLQADYREEMRKDGLV